MPARVRSSVVLGPLAAISLLGAAAGCGEDRSTQAPSAAPGTGENPIGAGAGQNAGGAGGGTPGPASCNYPNAPFGVLEGETIDEELAWEGFAEGAAGQGVVEIESYHDCEGDLGSKAILVLQVAEWCGICQGEAADVNDLLVGAWSELGIRVLHLVSEDAEGDPADLETAARWHEVFGTARNAVAADPAFTFAVDGVTVFPQKILVDPRTMTVFHHADGDVPIDAELQALLEQNE